ncbi:MAG: CinA family nicotinamide mononucleotide deamidase-related protein [Elusimicrobiaceae bacterium]|nr:CinA family nicotinamide mononucleotide deamidase-related protein [Elusimicrobiaceae bacterium]
MKAVIITIGDEILLGQILDTNSRFMARELTKLGAETVEMRSVADERNAIVRAINDASLHADVILLTGGLGPTKDDLTKKVLAEYFDCKLVQNEEVYHWLVEMFADIPSRMNKYNISQALLPEKCTPLRNRKGTASGMWFEHKNKVLVSLPGVPFEMEYLMHNEVLPRLKTKFTDLFLRFKMVTVFDVPESEIALKLADFEETLLEGISLAYLPSEGYVRLRLTAKGSAVEQLEKTYENLLTALQDLPYQPSSEGDSREDLLRRLKNAGVTVSCAESCTGGTIAHIITSMPGASEYFLGGVVSYANEVKQHVLGVSAHDLGKYGAVSEPVARQMAEGVRRLLGTQYALATTGVAGPDGGTKEKPVGTIWVAVAGPNGTVTEKLLISHTRERNIGRGSVHAIQLLLAQIEKDKRS